MAALRAYPVPLVSQIGSDPSAPPAVQHPWWPSIQRPHLTAHRFGSSLSAHLACQKFTTLIRSSHTLVVADHPLLLTAFVLADYIWPHDRMYRLPGGYFAPRASHQAVASFACLGRERLMEQPVSSRITSCKTETQATFRSHKHVLGNVHSNDRQLCGSLHGGASSSSGYDKAPLLHNDPIFASYRCRHSSATSRTQWLVMEETSIPSTDIKQ